MGSDLLVLDIGPMEAVPELFTQLERAGRPLPSTFSWNRDYEPFARQRDEKMKDFIASRGIQHFSRRDHLVIEPHELEKAPGQGYQVYSPFSRKWLEIFRQDEFRKRVESQGQGINYLQRLRENKVEKIFSLTWVDLFAGKISYPDHLSEYCQENQKGVTVPIPRAGSLAAYEKVLSFKNKIEQYRAKRDFPAVEGTSQLSPYLKNGSVTSSQIIFLLALEAYKKKESGKEVFFSEVIWREFFYHILFRHPYVETQAFVEKYRDIRWQNDENLFLAWKEGRTGFPIVDAGMRQLRETGWMHNRVRMIVASFLVKDLLIDWRWGEKYFMETLLDGDLAPNNGGWQWAASTGCDPQPYFRIFNPWLQSKKFDPEGLYIKTYIPELANLPVKELHQPITSHQDYPPPIVEHSVQREKALTLFKAQ